MQKFGSFGNENVKIHQVLSLEILRETFVCKTSSYIFLEMILLKDVNYTLYTTILNRFWFFLSSKVWDSLPKCCMCAPSSSLYLMDKTTINIKLIILQYIWLFFEDEILVKFCKCSKLCSECSIQYASALNLKSIETFLYKFWDQQLQGQFQFPNLFLFFQQNWRYLLVCVKFPVDLVLLKYK